jgi:hypothetical protein
MVDTTADEVRCKATGRPFVPAPAHNNVVAASARLRRAPGYTAPKARWHVNELVEV